jgi:6-phosphogluconolactonase
MALTEKLFATAEALNQSFAEEITGILSAAIVERGSASLIVSGGRTPLPLFQKLSNQDIDWEKVTIALADERWVSPEHADSNEKLVRENLLTGKAASASFFAMKTDDENAEDAVATLSANNLQPKIPFDVLILGMGEDAHTASLFPCCDQIQAGLDMSSQQTFIATQPQTAPHQRMSYTLSALVKASNIFLHLTGDKKRQVLTEALTAKNEAEKPIKAVVERAPVTLMWAP